jgi:hypothetical protein
MSRGLLDPSILEIISNCQRLNPIVMAPGMIIKQIGETDEFKSMFAEIFNNLHEDTPEENKLLESGETNKLKEFYKNLNY